jgi:3-deoxy-D-manno-octulosonic-acid transferase
MIYFKITDKVRYNHLKERNSYDFENQIQNRKNNSNKRILIHAVSVGEVAAVKPLIDYFLKYHPEINITVSNVTLTGRKMATKLYGDKVEYIWFPFDFKRNCRKFLKFLNPYIVLIAETEIWPNFLTEAKNLCIPAIMINGRISPDSYKKYSRVKFLLKKYLNCFELMAVQTEEDKKRIIEIGALSEKVYVMGNLKFEAMLEKIDEKKFENFVYEMAIPAERKIITVGSTHEGEEKFVLSSFMKLKGEFPDLSIILAPRHPERVEQVIDLLKKTSLTWILKTEIDPIYPNKYDVTVLNTIGELQLSYAISDMAIIGGSFVPNGGHNILEALKFGIPVFYGKYMYNFEFIKNEAEKFNCGFVIENAEELYEKILFYYKNENEYIKIEENCEKLIAANTGSLKKILSVVNKFI